MRHWRIGLLLAIILAGICGAVVPQTASAVASGGTPPIAPLPDGRVLIVGVGRSEVYDPATGTTATTGYPATQPGYGHTLTALRDGRVLLVGGLTGSRGAGVLNRAERYDPATGRWTPAASLRMPRTDHAAVILADGRVLVVGGASDGSAEIYDPVADRWTSGGAPKMPTVSGAALTALSDGTVLATLGNLAERYDPMTGRWKTVGRLRHERADHTATLLADGRVLLTGGRASNGDLATAELYDPATDRAVEAGALHAARLGHTATPLPDGRVVVIGGGVINASVSATVEVYDPVADRWSFLAPTVFGHTGHAALLLPSGRILLVGGNGNVGPTEQYRLDAPIRCFPETGQCLTGKFLDYWEAHGELAINGYPLTAPRFETLEDGKTYFVQYFERTRLELHPEANPPYDVQLGQFGRQIHPADPPVAPRAGARPFPETGHNLGGAFLAYWQENGGLAQFGFPLSEEFGETLEDGKRYTVQYFERARFERHPENQPPFDVLLGQFGRRILAENAPFAPAFRDLYVANPALAVRLGPPTGAAVMVAGATQPFERGRMFYLADGLLSSRDPGTPGIYVLCDDAARDLRSVFVHEDTWREGQPEGGGPGPEPGLYRPSRGFGKVWQEPIEPRACPGYAVTPREDATTLVAQRFRDNGLLVAAAAEPDVVYAFFFGEYFTIPGASGVYERFALPRR